MDARERKRQDMDFFVVPGTIEGIRGREQEE